jgi:hypothetical protein
MDFNLIIIFILVVIILYFIFNRITRPDGLTGILDAQKSNFISNDDAGIAKDNKKLTNYSFSIWTYVNDWNYNYGTKKSIFQKEGLEVYYASTQNDLIVKIDTYDPSDVDMNTVPFECGISNIPIQKWVNVIVSLHGKTIDTYINGKLVKTCVMQNVPKYMEGQGITMTGNGGFSGYTSKLKYINDSTDPQTAWNIYKKGWSESNILSVNSGYDVDLVVTKNGEVIY